MAAIWVSREASSWMFDRKSQIFVEKDKASEEKLMDLLLDAGADDIRENEDNWEILSAPENHHVVLEVIWKKPASPRNLPRSPWCAKNLLTLEGKNASGMLRMYEVIEEHEDVQSVYSNFDMDENDVEALA